MIESTVLDVCMTPLGSPVVPEVKITSVTALGSVPASDRRPARASQAVSRSAAKGSMSRPGVPRATHTRSRRGVSRQALGHRDVVEVAEALGDDEGSRLE